MKVTGVRISSKVLVIIFVMKANFIIRNLINWRKRSIIKTLILLMNTGFITKEILLLMKKMDKAKWFFPMEKSL